MVEGPDRAASSSSLSLVAMAMTIFAAGETRAADAIRIDEEGSRAGEMYELEEGPRTGGVLVPTFLLGEG